MTGKLPLRTDERCPECRAMNIRWITTNRMWTKVVRNHPQSTDGNRMCPSCFIVRAYAHGVNPSVWYLTAGPVTKRPSPRSTAGSTESESKNPLHGRGPMGLPSIFDTPVWLWRIYLFAFAWMLLGLVGIWTKVSDGLPAFFIGGSFGVIGTGLMMCLMVIWERRNR